MNRNQLLLYLAFGFAFLTVASCSGSSSGEQSDQTPLTPPVSSLFSVDIMNAATGFVMETNVVGSIELDAYESEIRVVVNSQVDLSRLQFQLSDISRPHCPGIVQEDSTVPYEFTVDTPEAGGECEYRMQGTEAAAANVVEEILSISYSSTNNSPGSGGGVSESAGRYDFTYGTNGSSPYQVGSVTTREAHGNRIYCVISHFSYDDPVVFPGEPGLSHLHMFWGNTATDANTTSESILTTGSGSCEGGTDYRVGAWIPAVFNAQDEVVVPEEVFIYYKTFGGPGMRYDLVQPIPQGLGMLASADTQGFSDTFISGGFFDRNGQRSLSLNVTFPSCVATENGQRDGPPILDFRDMPGEAGNQLNSHVAYPSDGNNVDCPLSHPYRFPTPQFIMFFDAAETGNSPYLSSDAMAGAAPLSTLHGDYMFGANQDVNEQILQCIREARSCGFEGGRAQLPDRFLGPIGEVYLSSAALADGVDRTPFGNTLEAILPQSVAAKSSIHQHHTSASKLGSVGFMSEFDFAADIFTLSDLRWIGTIFNGAVLHGPLDEEVFIELNLSPHVLNDVGSVEILINDDVIAIDNDVPFHSFGDADAEGRFGVSLDEGDHTLRVRFYEQDNLKGSFLDEWAMTFTLH